MIGWVLTVLAIALIAGALGLGSIAGTALSLAELVFAVAIVLLVISILAGLVTRGRPPAL